MRSSGARDLDAAGGRVDAECLVLALTLECDQRDLAPVIDVGKMKLDAWPVDPPGSGSGPFSISTTSSQSSFARCSTRQLPTMPAPTTATLALDGAVRRSRMPASPGHAIPRLPNSTAEGPPKPAAGTPGHEPHPHPPARLTARDGPSALGAPLRLGGHACSLGARLNGSRANTRRTIGSKNSSGSDS